MTKIFYTASSQEEYSKLENPMNKLLRSYVIQGENNISVRTGFNDCVRVSPAQGKMLEFQQQEGEGIINGTLERLSVKHNFAKVTLEDTSYQIDFDDSVIS